MWSNCSCNISWKVLVINDELYYLMTVLICECNTRVSIRIYENIHSHVYMYAHIRRHMWYTYMYIYAQIRGNVWILACVYIYTVVIGYTQLAEKLGTCCPIVSLCVEDQKHETLLTASMTPWGNNCADDFCSHSNFFEICEMLCLYSCLYAFHFLCSSFYLMYNIFFIPCIQVSR